jgi:hypothetical protein
MPRYEIEYRAWTKYRIEFEAESLEAAIKLAEEVDHPLQLPESEQEWLNEDTESWNPQDIQEVG